MHTDSIKANVVKLRVKGHSYSYISARTGVSKSTLSGWLADIPYTPNRETVERVGKAIAAANKRKTELRQQESEKIKKVAAKEIGSLSRRDLFMFGLGLYVGDGAKTHDITRVTNSDVDVMRLAIAWFEGLGVTKDQFRITLHIYPDSKIQECLHFWSRATTIPLSQFGKVQVDTRTNKRKNRAGKLPHGTAHLSVRGLGRNEFGVALARRIEGWILAVSQEVNKKRAWSNGMTRPFQG